MARPRKAQVEGAAHKPAKADEVVTSKPEAENDDGTKHGINQSPLDMTDDAGDFMAIVEAFKAKFPDDWDAIALCPTQHGLEIMAEKLKGQG